MIDKVRIMLKSKVAQESGILFFAQILNVLLTGLVMMVLRPYFLSPAEIGLISYANSIIVTLAHFFNFGIDNTGCRLILFEKNIDEKKKIAGMTFFVSLVIAFVFSIIIYGITYLIPLFGNKEVIPLIRMVIPFVSYVLLQFFATNICYALGRIKTAAVITVLFSATYLPIMLILYKFGLYNLGSAMFSEFSIQFAVAIAAILVIGNKYIRFDKQLVKPMLNENKNVGIKVFIARIIFLPTFDIDKIILGAFYAMEVVGYYSLGRMIAAPTIFLGHSIGQTMYRRYATQNVLNGKVLKMTFVAVLGVSVAVFIAGSILVGIFLDESYKPILSILPLTVVSALINGYMAVFTSFMDAKGMANETRKIAIVGMGLSLILYFSLIIPFGMYGAIIARMTVLGVILIMRINYTREYNENILL